jgi:hypothetical protein
MRKWGVIGGSAGLLAAGAALIGYGGYRRGTAEAREAYATVLGHPAPPRGRFDPAQVAGLPEIAQRYFLHAVAPGTPLYSTAEVEMQGLFLLGDKRKYQTYEMSARQALRPPDQFVWIPRLRSGPLVIRGSDALVDGRAWTRFWMLGLLPVADDRSSPDLVRSAQFRAAVEGALWLPTSLLPENGVEWRQAGPDQATVTLSRFKPDPIVLTLTLDRHGAVREVVGQRWSNANPDKSFRLQPFGAAILAEGTFAGLTVPTKIAAGNHYGTEDYLPFFQATVTNMKYR